MIHQGKVDWTLFNLKFSAYISFTSVCWKSFRRKQIYVVLKQETTQRHVESKIDSWKDVDI